MWSQRHGFCVAERSYLNAWRLLPMSLGLWQSPGSWYFSFLIQLILLFVSHLRAPLAPFSVSRSAQTQRKGTGWKKKAGAVVTVVFEGCEQCSSCRWLVAVAPKTLSPCTPLPEGWHEESPSRCGLHTSPLQGRRLSAFCGAAAQLRPCATPVALRTEPVLRRQVLANLFAYLPFSVCTAWINTLCRNHELICIHCSDYLRFCWWSQPAKCCFLMSFWPVSQRREHVCRPWWPPVWYICSTSWWWQRNANKSIKCPS